jgi:hypothetical protein
MAVTWVGYNGSISEVEAIVKLQPPGSVFSSTSKPLTEENVATINEQMMAHINNALRTKGVTVPVTDEDDKLQLAIINTYLTVEVVEEVRWKVLENQSSGVTAISSYWGNLGRKLLNQFVDGRLQFSENTVQSGYTGLIGLADTTMKDTEPFFNRDYTW